MSDPNQRERFFALLAEARDMYLSGGSETRRGLVRALEAVFAALSGEVRSPQERESIIPLIVLSNALSDLDDGIPSRLFKVARKVGRHKDGFGTGMLKVSSAVMVDLLHGQEKSICDSAKLVAAWLDKAGARTALGHRIAATTVLGWREEIRGMVRSRNKAHVFFSDAYHDLKRSFSGKNLTQQDQLRTEFVRHIRLFAPDLIRQRKIPNKPPG
jgi:hypothetical protein